MATCNDCIKNDVCELFVHLHDVQDVESRCKHIKNKDEIINDFIEKCKAKQEFMRGEDNKYKGYVSIEDLESLKKVGESYDAADKR